MLDRLHSAQNIGLVQSIKKDNFYNQQRISLYIIYSNIEFRLMYAKLVHSVESTYKKTCYHDCNHHQPYNIMVTLH